MCHFTFSFYSILVENVLVTKFIAKRETKISYTRGI